MKYLGVNLNSKLLWKFKYRKGYTQVQFSSLALQENNRIEMRTETKAQLAESYANGLTRVTAIDSATNQGEGNQN